MPSRREVSRRHRGGLFREYAAESAPATRSGLDREPTTLPGVQAAVKIDCLAAVGVEELGDPGRAGTDGADTDNPIVELVHALHQLIHRNVDRARDPSSRPLVVGANVEEHPSVGHSGSDIAGLNGWHLVFKHKINPSLVRARIVSPHKATNAVPIPDIALICGFERSNDAKADRSSSAMPDECHRLGNQFPRRLIVHGQPHPLLHGLAFAGIERHPVTCRDQLRDPGGWQLHDDPVVDQHREDRLIDLDRIGSETGAAGWYGNPAHAGVLIAERLEQC
jgi:hypothetical protein